MSTGRRDDAAPSAWERLRLEAPTECALPDAGVARDLDATASAAAVRCLFGVDDGDAVCALAPFEQVSSRRVHGAPSPGLGVADYLDVLLPPSPATRSAALDVLVRGCWRARDAWDALDLPASQRVAYRRDLTTMAARSGLRAAVLPGYARPEIALTGDWDEYLKARPGRFRYNLRSRLRRLEERGEVRFRTG